MDEKTLPSYPAGHFGAHRYVFKTIIIACVLALSGHAGPIAAPDSEWKTNFPAFLSLLSDLRNQSFPIPKKVLQHPKQYLFKAIGGGGKSVANVVFKNSAPGTMQHALSELTGDGMIDWEAPVRGVQTNKLAGDRMLVVLGLPGGFGYPSSDSYALGHSYAEKVRQFPDDFQVTPFIKVSVPASDVERYSLSAGDTVRFKASIKRNDEWNGVVIFHTVEYSGSGIPPPNPFEWSLRDTGKVKVQIYIPLTNAVYVSITKPSAAPGEVSGVTVP